MTFQYPAIRPKGDKKETKMPCKGKKHPPMPFGGKGKGKGK